MAVSPGLEPRSHVRASLLSSVLSCLSIIAIGSLPAAVAMVHCHCQTARQRPRTGLPVRMHMHAVVHACAPFLPARCYLHAQLLIHVYLYNRGTTCHMCT